MILTLSRSPRLAVALLLVGVGCESPAPSLPIEYETTNLRIGSDRSICQGDLHTFERAISFMEDDLGLELAQPVTVYLWSSAGWEARGADACSLWAHAFGCYDYTHSTVYASLYSLYHELAHAVVNNQKLDVFFNEGIANAYGGRNLPFGETAPTSNAYLSRENYDHLTSAHFTRWLRERWGGYKLGRLATLDGSAFDNFEHVYGVSLHEAEALYFAEAPSMYPSLYGCSDPELPTRDLTGGWAEEIKLDCDHSDTLAGGLGLMAKRTLVVDEDGRYSLFTNAVVLSAHRCADGPISAYVDDPELHEDDIPPEYAAYPSPHLRYFEGGEVHTVELRRGRYSFTVSSESFEPGSVAIAVWPSLSPGPVDPGGI